MSRTLPAAIIRQASHEIGFFYISNHGVSDDLIAQTFTETKRFFDLPLEVKNQVSITHFPITRGYEPLGYQTLDLNAASDLKEGYYIGIERGPDDPLVQANTPNHGANQWLADLVGWREHLEHYFAAMLALARCLCGGLALSLYLEEHYLDAMVDNPMAILRLLHYPPHPTNAGTNQLGCGAQQPNLFIQLENIFQYSVIESPSGLRPSFALPSSPSFGNSRDSGNTSTHSLG